jgi:hypothetical protein
MTALRAKQAELQAVLDKLAALDADLAEKTARKESLEAEVALCKVKLDRCMRTQQHRQCFRQHKQMHILQHRESACVVLPVMLATLSRGRGGAVQGQAGQVRVLHALWCGNRHVQA